MPDAWAQIEKFELEKPFWEMVTTKFGYRDDDPTLKKLIIQLLMSEFAHQLGTATPAAIHNQQLDRNGTHNAVVFLVTGVTAASMHPDITWSRMLCSKLHAS